MLSASYASFFEMPTCCERLEFASPSLNSVGFSGQAMFPGGNKLNRRGNLGWRRSKSRTERTFQMNAQDGQSWDPRVPESFNIFQASMTMLSIFSGFVFAALLQLLASSNPVTSGNQIVIRILLIALCCFMIAIFSFHHCAHRVVRHWQIFCQEAYL